MPATPVSQQFNIKYPHPRNLKTGDLLFPRKPDPLVEAFFSLESLWSASERAKTVGDLLGAERVRLVSKKTPGLDLGQLYARERPNLQLLENASDANNPARLMLLVKILLVAFEDLTIDWFGMTMQKFLRNPLVQVLMRALDGDILNANGFFVGHCAIVLREENGAHSDNVPPGDFGEGNVFVIEANVSDFDHYRVAIHPYYVENDGVNGRYRGWVNFRASQGNQVWQSRHKAFTGPGDAAAATLREQTLRTAKAYLGTSYSFFDDSRFGHAGRLYCSEYLYRTFEDVRRGALEQPPRPELHALDDRRTWQWMKDNNPRRHEGDMGDAIIKALEDEDIRKHIQNHPEFFILTVQMLWRSERLDHPFMPFNKPYDKPYA